MSETPEHIYNPSCARCRDEAGKDRAKVPDDDLCVWHLRVALAEAQREKDEATAEFDRLRQDRKDALAVQTREGWSASEWLARTGKAERERAEAQARRDAALNERDGYRIALSSAESRALAAEAEVARLREALEDEVVWLQASGDFSPAERLNRIFAIRRARAEPKEVRP